MLTSKYQQQLVEDDLKRSFGLRYATHTGITLFEYNVHSGNVTVTFGLPSGNLTSITVSARGINYAHEWLDRMAKTFPLAADYFMCLNIKTETYHKDMDWTKR